MHSGPFGFDHDFGMFITSYSKLFNLLMGCHKNELNVVAKILWEEPRYFVVLESANKTSKQEIVQHLKCFFRSNSMKDSHSFRVMLLFCVKFSSSYALLIIFTLCHTHFVLVLFLLKYFHYWRKICIPNGIVCIESWDQFCMKKKVGQMNKLVTFSFVVFVFLETLGIFSADSEFAGLFLVEYNRFLVFLWAFWAFLIILRSGFFICFLHKIRYFAELVRILAIYTNAWMHHYSKIKIVKLKYKICFPNGTVYIESWCQFCI